MRQLHLFTSYPRDPNRSGWEEHRVGHVLVAVQRLEQVRIDDKVATRIRVLLDNQAGSHSALAEGIDLYEAPDLDAEGSATHLSDGRWIGLLRPIIGRPLLSTREQFATLFHEEGHVLRARVEKENTEELADMDAAAIIRRLKIGGFDLGFTDAELEALCGA